jgi:NADH-quinone oxidoreductase subunit L
MPVTSATFIIGWLAIAGVPPFAGFWSKDEILVAAYGKGKALWLLGALTAGLTAYYMARQVALVFFGKERWREADHAGTPDKAELTEPEPVADDHAADGHAADGHGHSAEPHEAPWTMTAPLVVLAVLAVLGGVINLPFGRSYLLEHWLGGVGETFHHAATLASSTKVALGAAVTAVVLIATAVGFRLWSTRPEHPELEPVVLKRAWGVDALYSFIFGTGGGLVAAEAAAVDKAVIDGAVNGTGSAVRLGGTNLRKLQTGYVRNYALGIGVGAVLLFGYAIVRMGL